MMEKCNDQHVRYKEMERLMHCFVELHLRAGAWAILAKEYCIYMYTGRDVYDSWPGVGHYKIVYKFWSPSCSLAGMGSVFTS
jgi:hypothetical protein